MKVNIYSIKGKKSTIDLPKFMTVPINLKLLAQAMRVYEDRRHPGLSKVMTRGEKGTSTRKIYRQKGTGGARHGAKSAPIFVGGGIAHGPTGIKRVLSMPKKIRQRSLMVALSLKVKEGKLIMVDGLSDLKKTKDVVSLIKEIGLNEKSILKKARYTFILSDKNINLIRILRNIDNLKVVSYGRLNAYEVFFGGFIIFDKEAFENKKDIGKNEVKMVKKPKKSIKEVENKINKK